MKHITITKLNNFQKLIPDKGYLITKFDENIDDITDYYAGNEVDAPLDVDISIYKAITIKKDETYKKRRENALKEINNCE